MGQGTFRQRFVRLPSHQHGMSCCLFAEKAHVVGQMVEEAVVKTDGTVVRNSCNDMYVHRFGMRFSWMSDGHGGRDVRVWVVAFQSEVFVAEVEDGLDIGVEMHDRQLSRCALQLHLCLFDMVEI